MLPTLVSCLISLLQLLLMLLLLLVLLLLLTPPPLLLLVLPLLLLIPRLRLLLHLLFNSIAVASTKTSSSDGSVAAKSLPARPGKPYSPPKGTTENLSRLQATVPVLSCPVLSDFHVIIVGALLM